MQDWWTQTLDSIGLTDAFSPEKSVARMRDALDVAAPRIDLKAPEIEAARDLTYPAADGERRARLYIPHGSDAPAPLLLFFHGGGYMIGDLDTHDRLCRRLAAMSGVRVLSVDYRLAPENPYPAGLNDSLAAFDWARGAGAETLGADPGRIAVSGDSAGGGIAAVIAHRRRGEVKYQLLIYPLMQLAQTRKPKLKALEGHLFAVSTLDGIKAHYLGPEGEHGDPNDPGVSPLFEADLKGVAPAYIATAELDPLRDEAEAHARRLEAFGVPVKTVLGRGLPHGYFSATAILPGAKDLVHKAAAALGDALRG